MSRYTGLDLAIDLLCCPVCQRRGNADQALTRQDNRLVCDQRHSFDVARQGYLNLLSGPVPANADTGAMVEARQRFLTAGIYQPLRDAIARVSLEAHGDRAVTSADTGRGPSHTDSPVTPPLSIVEVGAGTGWYLSGIMDVYRDHGHPVLGIATDVSPMALRMAAKSGVAAVVADTWAGLPLRSASGDLVLCVFAPRNASEFARIVAGGGQVMIASPTPEHLQGLRQRHGLMQLGEDKQAQLIQQMSDAGLNHRRSELVRFDAECSAEQIGDLIGMGPNAFHQHGGVDGSEEITVSVQIDLFTH